MFENRFIIDVVFLFEAIISVGYTEKFLQEKTKKIFLRTFWVFGYLFSQILINQFVTNDVLTVVLQLLFFVFLEELLFYKNWSKATFVALSFISGKEIIKYITSVVSLYLYDLFGTFMLKKVETGTISIPLLKQYISIGNQLIFTFCKAFSLVALLAFLLVLVKKFIRKDYTLTLYQNIFLILPCITALCISITMKKMVVILENSYTVTIYDRVPQTKFWIPFICILLLGSILSSVILFQKLVQCMEEEKRRLLLENQVTQLQHETKEIQDIYGDIRGLKHDLNNHLNNIVCFVKSKMQNEETELQGYIEKMTQTVKKLDFTYETGNAITDIIIHQKKQKAEQEHLDLVVDFFFPQNTEIDVYDMSIILNNGLENAMEACKKEEKGSIYLKSYQKGNLFFVEIKNNCTNKVIIDKETGLPLTSKTDKNRHGIGLLNIKQCAQKYNGDIDIILTDEKDEKSFLLVIMLCETISHPK